MESAKEKDNTTSPQDRELVLYSTVAGNLFAGSRKLYFLYAKAEKIGGALYLVTEPLPAHNPLKNGLRRSATRVISALLSFITALQTRHETDVARTEALRCLQESVSLCRLMLASPGSSRMNFSILEREYEDLLVAVANVTREEAKESLSLEGLLSLRMSSDLPLNPSSFSTAGSSLTERRTVIKDTLGDALKMGAAAKKDIPVTPPRAREGTGERGVAEGKEARMAAVLTVLREKGPVSIKEVARTIADCSEKTVQRLLVDLVESGTVAREGERRWSVYRLAAK